MVQETNQKKGFFKAFLKIFNGETAMQKRKDKKEEERKENKKRRLDKG